MSKITDSRTPSAVNFLRISQSSRESVWILGKSVELGRRPVMAARDVLARDELEAMGMVVVARVVVRSAVGSIGGVVVRSAAGSIGGVVSFVEVAFVIA